MAEPDVARRGFRPALWPTVVALPALAVMLGLGTWQIQRLHWKEALFTERTARLAAPPLSAAMVHDPLGRDRFRRITMRGIFLHAREMLLVARTRQGRSGVNVITPLRLPGGGHVMVDRGWVPDALKDPARRPAGQVSGVVRLTGLIRAGGRPNLWVPDNRPDERIWHYVDVAAMAAHAGIAGAPPFYVVAGPAPNPGGYPVGAKMRVTVRNDHLQYALTWYGLAVALAVIYLLYHRKQANAR